MGHHFVPQRYLRNFEDPNHRGYVWVHDRYAGEGQLANIAKVAQSRNFYSQSTETILAETVERPANLVIRKLTTRQPVTDSERVQLAYYVAVMMKRIPAHRRRSSEMLPEVLADLVTEVRSYLNTLSGQVGADPEILKRRGFELDAVERKFHDKTRFAMVARRPAGPVDVVKPEEEGAKRCSKTYRTKVKPSMGIFVRKQEGLTAGNLRPYWRPSQPREVAHLCPRIRPARGAGRNRSRQHKR